MASPCVISVCGLLAVYQASSHTFLLNGGPGLQKDEADHQISILAVDSRIITQPPLRSQAAPMAFCNLSLEMEASMTVNDQYFQVV